MIVPCECGAKLKIDDAKIPDKGIKVRCPRCGNMLQVRRSASSVSASPARPRVSSVMPSSSPLILVAHDSEMIRKMISDVLTEDGFRVDTAADGVEALRKAESARPQGIVIDVGLPGIYGFELCSRLKGSPETKEIKIVLLSSVYDMRRYKRTPANLYGADDYIEKHHIPDFLANKFRRLIFPEQFVAEAPKTKEHSPIDLPEMSRPPAREFNPSILSTEGLPQSDRSPSHPSPSRTTAQKQQASKDALEGTALMPESFSLEASIFQKEECDIPKVEEADPEAVEKARRFARIIVSDIALYNQEVVVEGLKNGNFYELLKTDVDEGRELYERRVPDVIKSRKDYYQEAFDNFIASARRKIVH